MVNYKDQGYVGVTNNLERRTKHHFSNLRNNRHINPYLQHAFNQNNNMVVVVLYEGNEQECYEFERSARPSCNVGWNLIEGGSAPPRGYRKYTTLSEEHKAKLRDNHKGMSGKYHSSETKTKMSIAASNRTTSDKTRESISNSKKGENNPNFNKPRSQEVKDKIRKTNKTMVEIRHEYSSVTGIPYKQVSKKDANFCLYVDRCREEGRFD
jgi:hypothetical protein